MHIIWGILAHSQIQEYRGYKNNHRWQVWILFCIWKQSTLQNSRYETFRLNWIFNPSALLWNNICNHHEHWWLGGCLHCASISRAGFLLSWVDRREWLDYGLWLDGSSSRPRLGMYSDHCHQWRQSRDLLLAKPQSWTMVAARSLLGGENNGFVVTTEHIQIDTIPSPPHTHTASTRVQNGLVIVSSVCNSIIIHTTWRTQGSSLSECLQCILSLSPPCSHLSRDIMAPWQMLPSATSV